MKAGDALGLGSASPLDRLLLLAHVLDLPREAVYLQWQRELSPGEEESYRRLLALREQGQPVAYLLGEREFYSRSFRVGPGALVPQPDTEHLVEAALTLAPPGGRVVEVGVGSGAVLLTIALERPDLVCLGTDLSPEALEVARANRDRLGLTARVPLLQGDLLAPLQGRGPFDLLVMNPPYIPAGEIPHLPPEVRAQPLLALDGGGDGLRCYRVLVEQCRSILTTGGSIVLEIGAGQEEAVAEIFLRQELREILRRQDLAGWVRVLGFQA